MTNLVNALQQVAHEDTVLKYVGDVWGAMEAAQHEVTSKTELLKGSADEIYVRWVRKRRHGPDQRAAAADERLLAVAEEIGGAKAKRTQCEDWEAAAKIAAGAAHAAVTEARQHPEVDKDFEARQWDTLLDKYDSAYTAMVQHAEEQLAACRRRMATAVAAGSRELGIFLEKYREHAPQEIATDWLKSREWLKDLLKQLNDTQLAPFKADMDAAYRTSQETFRNDVAIALSNNLDWLDETMDRLNAVLRTCPAFSNGERYRFRRVIRPQLDSLLKFVKDVASYGPTADLLGGPGEIPEAFRQLIEDKLAPGAAGVRSPLDDYREFFEFDIEILREDPISKSVEGRRSPQQAPGARGQVASIVPRYTSSRGRRWRRPIASTAGKKDGLRLMLLDEAFNKMDMTNIIATMRYLEELGLQVFMASPGENLGT